jgi:hypothetical protein
MRTLSEIIGDQAKLTTAEKLRNGIVMGFYLFCILFLLIGFGAGLPVVIALLLTTMGVSEGVTALVVILCLCLEVGVGMVWLVEGDK